MLYGRFVLVCLFLLALPIAAQDTIPQENKIKKCPQCQYFEKREIANFCVHCGTKLVTAPTMAVFLCTQCKQALQKGETYCMSCGNKGEIVYQPIPEESEPDLPAIIPKTSGTVPVEAKKVIVEEKESPSMPWPDLNYPNAELIEEIALDEGLPHTAEHRTVIRKLFSATANLEDVEAFYRAKQVKAGITKGNLYDVFRFLRMKWQQPKGNIEIAYFAYGEDILPATLEMRHRTVKTRLAEESKAIRNIDNDIAVYEKFCKEGKLARSQIEERLTELKRRRNIATSSAAYWDLTAMDRVLTLRKKILVITMVLRK